MTWRRQTKKADYWQPKDSFRRISADEICRPREQFHGTCTPSCCCCCSDPEICTSNTIRKINFRLSLIHKSLRCWRWLESSRATFVPNQSLGREFEWVYIYKRWLGFYNFTKTGYLSWGSVRNPGSALMEPSRGDGLSTEWASSSAVISGDRWSSMAWCGKLKKICFTKVFHL